VMPGRDINADVVADCDVLLVRSVTQVNRDLLAGSKVRFVGSATSGIDHVDTVYLQAEDITFAHAPGCNADAVVQYMLAVFCICAPAWRRQTVGIIGCGQVGGRLYRLLTGLGVSCRVYDPWLPGVTPDMTSLDEVLTADIVCLHTPLTRTGKYPTHHMIDAAALSAMTPGALLINAARGEVVDNRALSRHLSSDGNLKVVLDVWEGEPCIDLSLLEQLVLTSPHIAGYSVDGRRRGSEMVHRAFCSWRAQPDVQDSGFSSLPEASPKKLPEDAQVNLKISGGSFEDYILATFDLVSESRRMTSALSVIDAGDDSEVARVFDGLRKTCPARREFSHYRVRGLRGEALARDLKVLGFNVGAF